MDDPTNSELDSRVRKLEATVWVVTVVAGIFGIGGASLWAKLSELKTTAGNLATEVQGLQNQVKVVQADFNQTIASAEANAKNDLTTFIDSHRQDLLKGVLRDGDRVAIQFASTQLYVGSANGKGQLDTGLNSPRKAVGPDETFLIWRH